MNAGRLSLLLGAVSAALMAGALWFQYVLRIAPCELCHWQRWPHIAAAVLGLGGGLLIASGSLNARWAPLVAGLTVLLIAGSGALAFYHAGVEWKFWAGPAACTGERAVFTGLEGLNNEHVVRCDEAAWRLFGISLAGYNAVVSLAVAAWGALQLTQRKA